MDVTGINRVPWQKCRGRLLTFQGDAVARTSSIRLLKFVTVFGIGGTERQFVNLGLALDPSRFELRFACLRRWGELLREIEACRIPIAEYTANRLYGLKAWKEQLKLARDIRHDLVQIVHTYNFYANVFAIPAAKLAGVPVIVASIRNTGDDLTPMQRRVQRFVCRWADRIVVNADAVRHWLVREGYYPRKIVVIRNGVDLSRFTRRAGAARLRQELGLPPRAPLVATLCRLDQQKGIENFLEAAAIVARRFQEVRFLVVGDHFIVQDGAIVSDVAYRRKLEGYAVRLGLGGRVVFTGFRLDVAEILSEIAVSVLSSLSEGLSNTLLESMAAGVPVVATKVGGNPEVVQDGVTGFLVPPRQPEALANGICRLLQSRETAAAFGRAGKHRVAQHFSVERMVAETEQLYLRLLNKQPHKEKNLGDSTYVG